MVAARHFEGPKECSSACLGLGSCVRSCPVSAIRVVDGLARVDPQRCTGCGKCVASCPKGLITLVPSSSQWYVACNSQCLPEEKGKYCSVACTACGECSRLSTSWEFSQRENLAYASQSIPADGPGAGAWASIAARCPTGAIVRSGFENQTKNEQQEVEKKN
jgi:ferredoxin